MTKATYTNPDACSFCSGEYRRIVGLLFTSIFIALILIQRLRASAEPRADHLLTCVFARFHFW